MDPMPNANIHQEKTAMVMQHFQANAAGMGTFAPVPASLADTQYERLGTTCLDLEVPEAPLDGGTHTGMEEVVYVPCPLETAMASHTAHHNWPWGHRTVDHKEMAVTGSVWDLEMQTAH